MGLEQRGGLPADGAPAEQGQPRGGGGPAREDRYLSEDARPGGIPKVQERHGPRPPRAEGQRSSGAPRPRPALLSTLTPAAARWTPPLRLAACGWVGDTTAQPLRSQHPRGRSAWCLVTPAPAPHRGPIGAPPPPWPWPQCLSLRTSNRLLGPSVRLPARPPRGCQRTQDTDLTMLPPHFRTYTCSLGLSEPSPKSSLCP